MDIETLQDAVAANPADFKAFERLRESWTVSCLGVNIANVTKYVETLDTAAKRILFAARSVTIVGQRCGSHFAKV